MPSLDWSRVAEEGDPCSFCVCMDKEQAAIVAAFLFEQGNRFPDEGMALSALVRQTPTYNRELADACLVISTRLQEALMCGCGGGGGGGIQTVTSYTDILNEYNNTINNQQTFNDYTTAYNSSGVVGVAPEAGAATNVVRLEAAACIAWEQFIVYLRDAYKVALEASRQDAEDFLGGLGELVKGLLQGAIFAAKKYPKTAAAIFALERFVAFIGLAVSFEPEDIYAFLDNDEAIFNVVCCSNFEVNSIATIPTPAQFSIAFNDCEFDSETDEGKLIEAFRPLLNRDMYIVWLTLLEDWYNRDIIPKCECTEFQDALITFEPTGSTFAWSLPPGSEFGYGTEPASQIRSDIKGILPSWDGLLVRATHSTVGSNNRRERAFILIDLEGVYEVSRGTYDFYWINTAGETFGYTDVRYLDASDSTVYSASTGPASLGPKNTLQSKIFGPAIGTYIPNVAKIFICIGPARTNSGWNAGAGGVFVDNVAFRYR